MFALLLFIILLSIALMAILIIETKDPIKVILLYAMGALLVLDLYNISDTKGDDYYGAYKLYKGDYKIEIQDTYIDSVLVKTDTVVIDLIKNKAYHKQ